MPIFITTLMRRFGLIQKRRLFIPRGNLIGTLLGAAVGSLVLKRLLFSRRAKVGRGNGVTYRMDKTGPAVASPRDITPPHGDPLSRSVSKVATAPTHRL